ncbi:cell division protein FtsQ/DivIB [Streptomyces capparidis]
MTVALAALAAGGGAWLLYGSSLLEVRQVRVTGNEILTAGRIREAAGVSPGGALVEVDTAAVERRLLKELPRLERVEVARSWPDTLHVEVTEREPAAVLRKGAGYTEVDRTGVAYADVTTAPQGVPLVRLQLPRDPQGSATLREFGRRALLRSAVEVARSLPPQVRSATGSIDVRSYDDIQLLLSGGRTVAWGSAERGEEKREALAALLKAAPKAKRYDVTSPSSPAVQLPPAPPGR